MKARLVSIRGTFDRNSHGNCSGQTASAVRWVWKVLMRVLGASLARDAVSARESYQMRSSTTTHTPSVGPSATQLMCTTAAKTATVDAAGEPAPAADTTAAPTEEPFVPDQVCIFQL